MKTNTPKTHWNKEPTKHNHNAIGENIGYMQRLTEQLTTTQAIILTQKPTNKIPLKVCDHPATWILVEPNCNFQYKIDQYNAIHNPVKVEIKGTVYNKLKSIKVK